MWREFSTRMQTWLRKEGMREDFFEVDPRLGSRENAEREFIAENLADAPHRFGPAFVAKDWVLMKTDSPSLYFIGDHPLVMYNSLDFALHGNLGLTVQGVEIYFPLSPNLALGMMCASHAREFREGLQRMSQSDLSDPGRQKGISVARDFIRAVESGEPALMDPENVDFLNSLQIARSERFLFSHDGNFALAEKMIADHPQARHGARIEEATGKF
jgi:hypothetical protein